MNIGSLLDFWDLEENDIKVALPDARLPSTSLQARRDGVAKQPQRKLTEVLGETNKETVSRDERIATVQQQTVGKTVHYSAGLEEDETSSQSYGASCLLCTVCSRFVNGEFNWCLQCGSSLTQKLTPANYITNTQVWQQNSLTKSQSTRTKFKVETYLGTELFSAESELARSPSPGIQASVIQKRRVRHWSSSGVYMWRKPSSIRREGTLSTKCTYTPVTECHLRPTSGLLQSPGSVSLAGDDSTASSLLLLSLPVEILMLILSFLKQTDLASCMLVCHKLYVIAAHPCLWSSVCIVKKTDMNDEVMLNISRKKPHRLKLVHNSGRISSSVLQKSFMKMTQLQELFMDACNFGPFTGDQLLICASIHCHHLHSLHVGWIELSDSALRLFTEHSQRLHHSVLSLTYLCLLIFRLKKLSIESIPLISMDTVYLLMLKHRTRLTHVQIQGNLSFSVQDLLQKFSSSSITFPQITFFSTDDSIVYSSLLFPRLFLV